MSNYFARVELHDADWPDDYADLHRRLAKVGFTRCITFTNGETQKLPTGFYFAKGKSKDKKAVAASVFSAANATGYANEVVVVRSMGSESSLSESCD